MIQSLVHSIELDNDDRLLLDTFRVKRNAADYTGELVDEGSVVDCIDAALFGQPDRSFFVTQIMELAKSGRGAVQRELERLHKGGLVTVHKVATQKHFQANAASPLFEELCGIIQKTVGLAGPIREALEALPETPTLALIYGSLAKRTDTSSSDIDLLVVSDSAELEQVYAAMMPVERVLARPISLTLYTEVDFQERLDNENPFVARILSSPTINLIGSVDVK
jgi:predicted nucleotidyltransferase